MAFHVSGTGALDDPSVLDSAAGPALRFYGKYLQKIWSNDCAGLFNVTIPYDEFYAADLKHFFTDGHSEVGGPACWEFFRKYYGQYDSVTQDSIAWVVIAKGGDNGYELWGQSLMHFKFEGSEKERSVPRFFCYTIGKADEGKGTDGLQVRMLRDYYNEPLIWRESYADSE